ncbi:unnamed protein product, partial [Didymodactylos carnosus]
SKNSEIIYESFSNGNNQTIYLQRIKGYRGSIMYKQHEQTINGRTQCRVQYKNQTMIEDETIQINGKYYKVEQCQLIRAFQTCSTKHLLNMLKIVCTRANRPSSTTTINRYRRFLVSFDKTLLDVCCYRSCTVTEITHYCA